MTDEIKWLRNEDECEYAIEYLKQRANAQQHECITEADMKLARRSPARTQAEALARALLQENHRDILRDLQNNLRQRRSRRANKERRFNLTNEACEALDQLTKEFGKSPSETVSTLLINSPETLKAARENWMAEHKKQIEQWTYEHLSLKHQLKRKGREINELHKHLRSHIRALEMWKTSMGSDTPPFDGKLEQLDEQVNERHRIIQRDVKAQVKVLSSIPD